MSDLSILDTTGDAELILKHPGNGKPLDIVLILPSCDSKRYQDILSELLKQNDKPILLPDWQKNITAKALIDWKNVVLDNEKIEFNENNVDLVLTRFPWITEQAWTFMLTRANFLTEPQSD